MRNMKMPQKPEEPNLENMLAKKIRQIIHEIDATNLPEGHFARGFIFYEEGRLKEAVFEYNAEIDANPNNTEARHGLAKALYHRGDHEGSIRECKTIIDIDPKDMSARYNLVLVYYRLDNLQEAIENTINAVDVSLQLKEENSQYTNAYHNWVKLNNERYLEEQVEKYKRLISVEPDNADAYNSLGVALTRIGDFEGAVDHYRKSIELDPTDQIVHKNLEIALGKLDKISEYRKILAMGLEVGPISPDCKKAIEMIDSCFQTKKDE
jgi:protein O-GlcNAc transferase